MEINHLYIADSLERNLDLFEKLLRGLSKEEYLWKSKPEKWCILEILCHLIDEEKEDFRTRVRVTLESPGQLPPPIDPVGWVKSRNYINQSFDSKLNEFKSEREASVAWIRSIQNPDWTNSYEHPTLGTLSASMFINNWLAHDYMHIRQILNVKFARLQNMSGADLSYAGNW